ncbi:MAG: YitT family protein [Bacteroidales bacterium]|nr:YitT family protein [Bacteroidales bacterium]
MGEHTGKTLHLIKEYVVITFGVFIYAMGWELFFFPNKLASGGLTGLCTIIEYGTGFPTSVSYAVLNMLLLGLAVLLLGKSFGIKTIFAIGMSSFFLWMLSLPAFEPLYVRLDNRFLVAVVGSLVEGVGIGFTLMAGGSTGGTDIIAMIVNKFYPISLGKAYFTMDLFIVALLLLVPGMGFEDLIYGYLTMLVFSYTVDAVMLGRKSSVQIMIFSRQYQEIADHLVYRMDKGVTAMKCTGWYSQEDIKVLLVITRKTKLHDVLAAVKALDPTAFVSVAAASEVYGQGFDEVKTGINRKVLSESLTKKQESN